MDAPVGFNNKMSQASVPITKDDTASTSSRSCRIISMQVTTDNCFNGIFFVASTYAALLSELSKPKIEKKMKYVNLLVTVKYLSFKKKNDFWLTE